MHGFPPLQNAGTERVAALAAEGLRGRGWWVHTLAATTDVGAPMYTETEAPGVSRLVNNAPYAALRNGGEDAAARAWLERKLTQLRPDVVHVHHLAYLDPRFRSHAPIVWTLHDAWGWCAAGGHLFRDGRACNGPGAACARCAGAWAKDGPAVAVALGVAGAVARWIPPAGLHRQWQRLPAGLRGRLARGRGPLPAGTIDRRTHAYQAFAARCAARLSPSRWLADEAERQGFGPVQHLPNGVPAGPARAGGGPFLFLGTIAAHKGPDLVHEAHRRARLTTALDVVGPDGPDAIYVAAVPHRPTVQDPSALLSRARALVLGSRWPENAPMVVLEARAAGCPVIGPRLGGLPELIEPGRDGWLYEPGNVDDLARCLTAAEAGPPLAVRPPPTLEDHLDGLIRVYDALR